MFRRGRNSSDIVLAREDAPIPFRKRLPILPWCSMKLFRPRELRKSNPLKTPRILGRPRRNLARLVWAESQSFEQKRKLRKQKEMREPRDSLEERRFRLLV